MQATMTEEVKSEARAKEGWEEAKKPTEATTRPRHPEIQKETQLPPNQMALMAADAAAKASSCSPMNPLDSVTLLNSDILADNDEFDSVPPRKECTSSSNA